MTDLDDCGRIGEILPEYLAGRVSAEDERLVRTHLERCDECRDRAHAVRLLQQTPVPRPDPERWDRFVDGVVEAASPPRRRRRWIWAMAAAAVLAIAAGLLLRAPSPEGMVGGLEAVAREVAELPAEEAARWTVGIDPVGLVPAGPDAPSFSQEELREMMREVGRT